MWLHACIRKRDVREAEWQFYSAEGTETKGWGGQHNCADKLKLGLVSQAPAGSRD